MSWLERPEKKSKNPAEKFIQWRSNEKCFSYYDKEKEENIMVDLPLKIVILEHYHTVKGWNDDFESGIYANEVFSIGQEEFTVKSLKGGVISKGLYKENKEKIKSAGGHYARSIYAISKSLELINISLKGSAVASYSKFINDNGDNFTSNWIEISEAKEMKKGSIKYSVPIFNKSTEIKDKSQIKPFADTLQDYMLEYKSNAKQVPKESTVDQYKSDEQEDDLPF